MAAKFWKCDRCGELKSASENSFRVNTETTNVFNDTITLIPNWKLSIGRDYCAACKKVIEAVLAPIGNEVKR